MGLRGFAKDVSDFFKQKSYNDLVTFMRRSGEIGCDGSKTSLKSVKPQLNEYRSWIFNCTNLIQNKVSTVPFGFYKTESGEKLDSRNKGYRVFTKPFYKPNEFMSFRFLKSFCELQLDLCGMTCLLKLKNDLGQVWELWPLNMNDFMKVEVSGTMNKPKINYIFNINNNLVSFSIDDLSILRFPHPTKLWEGMSPIQAQAYSCDLDRYIEVYEKDFFQNSARVDMVLSTDEELGEEAATIVKERWKEKYGMGHFHDIAVLHSGLKPIPMKYTNKDFEFLALADWSKSKIIGAYNIPMAKFNTGGNRAESVTAEIVFNRECIQPRLTIWNEELTKDVLHSFDDRIDFWHDNPIPRDRDLEMKEARIYMAGFPVMKPNEFRTSVLGLPEEKGLDEVFVPKTFIPLSKLDDFIKNELDNRNNNGGNGGNGNETDPTRHDGDEPHVAPDGTDDRDDNPTDGRSFSGMEKTPEYYSNLFNSFEEKSRNYWNKHIVETLKQIENDDISEKQLEEKVEQIFEYLMSVTGKTIFKFYELNLFVNDVWACKIAKMGAKEFAKQVALKKKDSDKPFDEFIVELYDSDARLSKIVNALLKTTINYSKFEIFDSQGKMIRWKVQSNACGHRGRVKEMKIKSDDRFVVGNTKMRFPGENILNFDCDCTIEQGD